jgi:hypothetical protein
MVDENIEFSEEEDYVNPESQSIKTIVLRHISKISDLSCKEFTGAYWSKKPIKTQNGLIYTETYHEDVREAYCNAVDFLIDVLYPLGDKAFQTFIDAHEKIREQPKDIVEKQFCKRETFKEIHKMFERTDFWTSTGVQNE